MTNTSITLDRVSCVLPEGRTLFSDLSDTFDLRRTGLVGRSGRSPAHGGPARRRGAAPCAGAAPLDLSLPPLDLSLRGGQRLAVTGPNGCGKSRLLDLLAGRSAPVAGRVQRFVPCAYLDQRLSWLDAPRPVLELLREASPGLPEAVLRTRLAQLGLGPQQLALPGERLSGGERLKAALACALQGDPPAQLLLLDEPCNHLDLPSLQALQDLLRGYAGALVVVSHDEAFLARIALTDRLQWTPDGWRQESA